jgi:predicted DNA-binding ribbon-helix-helix protein
MEHLGQQERVNTKRSIKINGHPTGVSLEDAFWNALREIATARGVTIATLVSTIDNARQHPNLSSAIRLFVLDYYLALSDGSKSAGRRADKKGRSAHRAAPLQ